MQQTLFVMTGLLPSDVSRVYVPNCRLLLTKIVLSVAISVACPAVEEDMPSLTLISSWLLLPAVNLHSSDEQFQFHPQAFLSFSGSSIAEEGLPKSQRVGFGGVVGGEVRWSPVSDHMITVHALGGAGVVAETQDVSPLRGMAEGAWVYSGPLVTNRLEGMANYDTHFLVQAGLHYLAARQQFQDRLSIEGAKSTITFRPWIFHERFLEPGPFFLPGQRDSLTCGTDVGVAHALGSRFRMLGSLKGQSITYDDPQPYIDGGSVTGAAGLSLNPTDHVEARLEVGLSAWRFDDNWNRDPAADDRQALLPEGELSVTWNWREYGRDLGRLELFLRRSSMPALGSNVALVDDLGLHFKHPLPQRWFVVFDGGILRITNLGNNQGDVPEQRTEWHAEFGMEYLLRRGVVFRPFVRASISRARYQNDFDDYSAGLQVIAVF